MGPLARVRACVSAGKNDLPVGPTPPASGADHLLAAVEWLCRSQDVTGTGGSAATYNLVLGWEEAYPETTGYIIPTLFSCAATLDNPGLADRAVRMADWLCTVQHDNGSFPSGTGTDGDPNVFNTGQVVLGLVRAFEETGDRRYRNVVRAACDWLVDQQTPEGYWSEHDYKGQAHAYSTRIGWSLLEAATVVPERSERYRETARRNLYWAVDLQRPNGWFEKAAFEAGETPVLHTIAYTVRGLVEGGHRLDDDTLLQAGRRTADELLAVQATGGVLGGAFDAQWSSSWYHCLTGNAQMAVVWFRLLELTGEHRYRSGARESLGFLKRHQVLDGPAQVRGALAGSYPVFGPYMYLRYPNWATKFFVDGLLAARDCETDRGTRGSPVEDGSPV